MTDIICISPLLTKNRNNDLGIFIFSPPDFPSVSLLEVITEQNKGIPAHFQYPQRLIPNKQGG